jgi:hypothetical protein
MIKTKFTRKRLILAVAMLPFLLLAAQAFGQSAGVSGTVTDETGGVLPGTTVTATNSATSVKSTTTTNNAGVYNFASLPPGTYIVSAEMPGFQTLKRTDVVLAVGGQLRINFEMKVSGIETTLEVSTSAADLILESTATTGTVMSEKTAKDLPLIGNDVMQLVNVMGGVVKPENTIFGNSSQTFAGVPADNINITRDGISVNDARYSSGIVSPARLNPEMVGEFKLILTPVDAEMGRGAGQVQVMTKSGGNEYHGSGVWSNINTALDAREWNDNRLNNEPMWKNVNQYTISAGGPIIKNKTFFFASYDQSIARKREVIFSNMLTPCARKGIYRYFPGWMPDDADAVISRGNAWTPGSRPAVNSDGTPLTPADNPNGTPYTQLPEGNGITADGMAYGSVLGPLTQGALDQIAADPVNCSQFDFGMSNTGVVPGSFWNADRQYDSSGYIDKFSTFMPMPNYYNEGDGLNVAALAWNRTTHGEDTVYGSGMDSARKSFTVKIDHNLSEKHRVSGMFGYERSQADGENEPTWPAPYGYGGYIDRRPKNVSATLTSTLKPTLLNEFRFGLAYNMNRTMGPIANPTTEADLAALLQDLVPTGDWADWQSLPVIVQPGVSNFRFNAAESNPYGGRSDTPGTWGSNDYRWTYSDTLTWTKGSHSFKFGADVRLTKAQSQNDGDPTGYTNNWFPNAFGGSATNAPPSGLTAAVGSGAFKGLVGFDQSPYGAASGTYKEIYDLMDYMAGSIQEVRQEYFVQDSTATSWADPSTPEGQIRYLRMKQREFSFFIKDDWKVNSDLTLNLGVRYEYYGVPWVLDGMTVGVVGGAQNIFGGQEGGFDQWLQGGAAFNPDNLTAQHFIGPESPNPDQTLFNKDLNNFAPAVGFAWQLPWWGKGKTTLRGGYQVSYSQISRLDPAGGMMNVAGSQPGLIYPHVYKGDNINNKYLNIAGMQDLIPTSKFWDGSVEPLAIRPTTDGTATAAVYDPNVRSPYIQSLTMALTRQIGSSLTLDVRYIGTLSRKQIGFISLNANNWINNGLKEAFDLARSGQESALLNDLYNVSSGGSAQLRANFYASTALATGNYNEVANVLKTSNGSYPVGSSVQGELIRRSGLGENFITTNPQFSAANMLANLNHSNYHSLQTKVTLRPTHGLNFEGTYTWSRSLGVRPVGTIGTFGDPYTDPLNRAADYGITAGHRAHTLTTYGTYNLPLGGPNGYLLRDSSGWVRKLAEGWQVSWVSSMTTGLPYSVTTVNSMWGGSGVDLVDPSLFDTQGGQVTWEHGARDGRYFGMNQFVQVNDPQCNGVYGVSEGGASLQATCRQNLKALAVVNPDGSAGPIVFQHAKPGVVGSFQPNSLTSPGRWSLDMALSKDVQFMEGKSINFRMDINNIFNHGTPSGTAPFTYDQRTYAPGNPISDLNAGTGTPFGYVGYKVGHRVFSVKMRISF